MNIDKRTLEAAVAEQLISDDQAQRLWAFLAARAEDTPRFSFTNILYYLGGLIAIGAMSLFMTLGWENFGGWGIFFIALAYAGAGLKLADYFLNHKRLAVPAGIMATFVIVLTPLAVYGLQQGLGWWAGDHPYREYHVYIDWNWIMMEFATLAVGAAMVWRYRFSFLLMPVAITLWYMSMDLVPFVFGGLEQSWELRRLVSLYFGLLMTGLAFWVDVRSRGVRDYAFWLYLFGVLTFRCGLSFQSSDSELAKFIYLCINLVMIGVGAVLSRRVFVVFGGLGTAFYLGHLAYDVFKDSMLFPFALTAIGLAVIYTGVLWQRHEGTISKSLCAALPLPLRELVGHRR